MTRAHALLALPLLVLPLAACGGGPSTAAKGSGRSTEIYDVQKQARIYAAEATDPGATFDMAARTRAFHSVADEDLAGTDFRAKSAAQQETFAKQLCANYDNGYDWVRNIAYIKNHAPGLSGAQMGQLSAIATEAFCPSYSDKAPQ